MPNQAWTGEARLRRVWNGGSIPPEDYQIPTPADPMPEALLDTGRRGDPMHRVEDPECEE
jgi:hypothetical protein